MNIFKQDYDGKVADNAKTLVESALSYEDIYEPALVNPHMTDVEQLNEADLATKKQSAEIMKFLKKDFPKLKVDIIKIDTRNNGEKTMSVRFSGEKTPVVMSMLPDHSRKGIYKYLNR